MTRTRFSTNFSVTDLLRVMMDWANYMKKEKKLYASGNVISYSDPPPFDDETTQRKKTIKVSIQFGSYSSPGRLKLGKEQKQRVKASLKMFQMTIAPWTGKRIHVVCRTRPLLGKFSCTITMTCYGN